MDRAMIGTYVEVARSLSFGEPGPTLSVQQLHQPILILKAKLSFQRLSLNGFSSPINMQYLDG